MNPDRDTISIIVLCVIAIVLLGLFLWSEWRARRNHSSLKAELNAVLDDERQRLRQMLHAFSETIHDHVSKENTKVHRQVRELTLRMDDVKDHVKAMQKAGMDRLHTNIDSLHAKFDKRIAAIGAAGEKMEDAVTGEQDTQSGGRADDAPSAGGGDPAAPQNAGGAKS